MRLISSGLIMISMILLPGLAFAQYGYVRECKETVANQLNVSTLDVSAELGPFSPNGNRIVNWRSRRASDRIGFCEFNTATGELVRSQSGDYRGPVANGRAYRSGPGQEANWNRENVVNVPSVKVSNSGRGNFKSRNKSVRLKRAWVNTGGQRAIVVLSGEDFKISLYGRIVQQNGGREFTVDINNSNRGHASGTATVRFSPDLKMVEYLSVNGQLNGKDFNGDFRR